MKFWIIINWFNQSIERLNKKLGLDSLLWKIIKGFIQCYHYIESLKLNNMNSIYYNRD